MLKKLFGWLNRDRSRQLNPIQLEILRILSDDLDFDNLDELDEFELGSLEWGLALFQYLQANQMSGFEILEVLRQKQRFQQVGIGRLYPALNWLEHKHLIQSDFLSGTPPRRKVFHITPAGLQTLRELDS